MQALKVTRGEYVFRPLHIEIADANLVSLFLQTLWSGIDRLTEEGERSAMTAVAEEIARVRNEA